MLFNIMSDFEEVINKRRSIREYVDKNVTVAEYSDFTPKIIYSSFFLFVISTKR